MKILGSMSKAGKYIKDVSDLDKTKQEGNKGIMQLWKPLKSRRSNYINVQLKNT